MILRSPKARNTTTEGNTGEFTAGAVQELPAVSSHLGVFEESGAGDQQSPQQGFAQQGGYEEPFAETIQGEPEGSSHQLGAGGGYSGGSCHDGDDNPQESRLSIEREEERIINKHFKEQEAELAFQSESVKRQLAFQSESIKRGYDSDKRKADALRKVKRKRADETKSLPTRLREIKDDITDLKEDSHHQIEDLKQQNEEQIADLKKQNEDRIADLKKVQQKAARDKNMFLSLIKLPVEVVPFLTPQPELPPIHSFGDLDMLSSEDAEAYCRAYNLTETGDLPEQRVRIARFINLLQFEIKFTL